MATGKAEQPMTSKQPTPQAISALLRKAGYERSAFIPGTGRLRWDGTEVRGSRRRSWGFMVNRYGVDRVSVTHITGPVYNPDESEKRRDLALQRYADAIVAGGYLVRLSEDRPRFLVVTSSPDTPEGG
jgi:hypothetical protein